MSCIAAREWIWESEAREEPPADVAAHLDGCDGCRDELRARHATAKDLRGLRTKFEEDPEPSLDDRVVAAAQAAVVASSSGRFPVATDDLPPEEIPDDVADALADSLASDFGEQFAALTTGRLRVEQELARAKAMGLLDNDDALRTASDPSIAAAPAPAPASQWQPPRATPQWMAAAALVLAATLAIGFAAGRATAPPSTAPVTHATLATTTDGLQLSHRHRIHKVGLSPDAIDALSQGNTYLLTGPIGGPYQVVGVVGWDNLDDVPLPTTARSEIVVAVGPAGGFSKGNQLAANDLTSQDVEILGRRALPAPGR